MTDHHTTPVNARDLTPSLNTIQLDSNDSRAIESPTMSNPRPGRVRTSSFSSSPIQLHQLPRFTKSATVSTTSSSGSDISRLAVTHAMPATKTYRTSAEVGIGEFSKPRVNKRSRRDTNRSTKSDGGDDFRYYGRHGNQWLFNDFSVTDAVKKGWGRVFGKEEKGDWYEKRN